jgi:hypothetical protein
VPDGRQAGRRLQALLICRLGLRLGEAHADSLHAI